MVVVLPTLNPQRETPLMTLVEALARLAAAVASLQLQIANLGANGMTPEQQAQFSQAMADIATLKAQVEQMVLSMGATNERVTSQQAQIDAVVAQAAAAASAHAALRDEVGAMQSTVGALNESVGANGTAIATLRTEVDALKAGVGDIGSLPTLPQV